MMKPTLASLDTDLLPMAAKPLAVPSRLRLDGYRIVIVTMFVGLVVPMLTLAWLWFSTSGMGESRDSPNGRYEASVMKMRRGTWTGQIDRFIEIEDVEIESGRQIWHVVQRYAPDVDPPSYEMRGRRFADWAADSKSVSIPVAGGRTMTFDVP